MNQIMQGAPCTIFCDGTQTRAFTYIGDVAPAIMRSVEMPAPNNEVFNFGAETPYSVATLAQFVQEPIGVEAGFRFLEAREEVLYAHRKLERARGNPWIVSSSAFGRNSIV